MRIEIVTKPAANLLPVSVDGIRVDLRIDAADFDDEVIAIVRTAWETVERDAGVHMLATAVRVYFNDWPVCGESLEIPAKPITAVSQIEYRDENGAWTVLAGANYDVSLTGAPAMITQSKTGTWPTLYNFTRSIRVSCTVGYASANDVPPTWKHAIRLLARYLWEHDGKAWDAYERILDNIRYSAGPIHA